jgi:hypothetical protein
MPSANTVAQKPLGNFNPLSSFGHAWLLDCGDGLEWFSAGAKELPTYIAPSATRAGKAVLSGGNDIGSSQELDETKRRTVAAKIARKLSGDDAHPACSKGQRDRLE